MIIWCNKFKKKEKKIGLVFGEHGGGEENEFLNLVCY